MYFDKDRNLILYEDHNHIGFYPAKHVKMIYENLKKGKVYWEASPVYDITREEAAFILASWNDPNDRVRYYQCNESQFKDFLDVFGKMPS